MNLDLSLSENQSIANGKAQNEADNKPKSAKKSQNGKVFEINGNFCKILIVKFELSKKIHTFDGS